MNWLHYLLEANVYLAVFYLLYYILLAKETHYRLNRIYLLTTCIITYIIPFFQLGFLKPAMDTGATVSTIIINHSAKAGAVKPFELHWQDLLIYGYIAGAAATLVVFVIKIARLVRMISAEKHPLNDKYKLIRLENSNAAFSFFNYIFIGTNVSGAQTIIRHELVHVNQKHSADIIFLEVVKVAGWFNPFIYLLQRSLKTVHEYIADEHAAAFENDTLAYSSLLVSNAYGVGGPSITHSFFNYNLLKKRIIMLNQKRSGNLARLKYLAALPVCAGLLCASTLGFSKTYGTIDIAPQTISKDTLKIMGPAVASNASVKEVHLKANVKPKNNRVKPRIVDVVLLPPKADTINEIRIDPPAENRSKKSPKSFRNVTEVSSGKISQKMPPPPPPMNPGNVTVKFPPPNIKPSNAFKDLGLYISKYTRYPALAIEKRLVGSVVIGFKVADDKVTSASLIKGIGSGCDEEALRVVRAFSGTAKAPDGEYKIAVSFYIKGERMDKNASMEFGSDQNFAGEISIITNIK